MPTNYFALFYKTVNDYVDKRKPFRDEHLRLATEAHNNGSLVMAGAFSDPADAAMFILKGDGPAAAESFAINDPYVKNGLITDWHVRPWTVVVGSNSERK